MKRLIYIIGGTLLLMVSCTSKKNPNEAMVGDMDSIAVMDLCGLICHRHHPTGKVVLLTSLTARRRKETLAKAKI